MSWPMSISLVCPACEAQAPRRLPEPRESYGFRCGKCKAVFRSRLVTIRAKSSRGDRKSDSRQFTVRAIETAGGESLIEFTKTGWADVELRSRDWAVFSYLKGRVSLVQNLTVGVNYRVSKPTPLWKILFAFALVLGVPLAIWWMQQRR